MTPTRTVAAETEVNSELWTQCETGSTLTTQKFRLHRPCRLYRSKRTGAAVVEFAIVAPLFFLLVFGMIEYGRMVMVQQVITNASREGARRAVLDGATTSDIVAAVEEFLDQASVSGANLEIRVTPDPPGGAANGDPVGVEISVPFSDVSWMPSPMYLGGTTLEAKTVMRREGIK